MTALLWACALYLLFGTGDVEAQTCTSDYRENVYRCRLILLSAVNLSPTKVDEEIMLPLKFMRKICERQDYREALVCATNGLKVCGEDIDYPKELKFMLKNIDEPFVRRICDAMPVLEQNLPCLNGHVNSSTFRECIRPSFSHLHDCRSKMVAVVCAVSEVQTACPSIEKLLSEVMRADFDPSCPIDTCMYPLGSCGYKFLQNMPVKAIQAVANNFSAISYGINYTCGSGRPHVECMMKGVSCPGFNSVMSIPLMFGIQLEPAGYLVNYGCKDINILTSKLQCLDRQFESEAFLKCFVETLSTMGRDSFPSGPNDVMSCDLYQGVSNCTKRIIAKECGEGAVDYYNKWSPAVSPLAEGCGSWKFSSASSVEKITTLILLQLLMVFLFLN
ncbi:hypothetical protein CHS0354_004547 [Potamilus streckersoni]|uniref:Uncharacterized protein n=1 Tax=Potamilus streckersoni TaxID=2493646 RepID=A0AAE0VPN9_9BIVA|nr:hypothetical protein CHS0354_004547 [Potamilus streckersoni]